MRIKKELGQHFLVSSDIADAIASCLGSIESFNVIEIGPGKGILTRALLRKNPLTLTTVEKDCECASFHEQLERSYSEKYKFILEDALNIDERELVSAPVKLIGNIPYNISTALLIKWLNILPFFSQITLLVQKEVAERISTVDAKRDGKLSALFGVFSDSKIQFDLGPESFYPRPKVKSSVINIFPLPRPRFYVQLEDLKKAVNIIFLHRRKVIGNSLKNVIDNPIEFLNALSISAKVRPEELSLEEICRITNKLAEIKFL